MKPMRELLREIISKNGGKRRFPKSGDRLMLAILADMAGKGELAPLGETDDEVVYGLPFQPDGETAEQ